MTTIVTGGTGFIGTHLCKELLKTTDVVVVDNLTSSSGESIPELEEVASHHNHSFKFINADICNVNIDFEFDKMYNLACIASPVLYRRYPMKVLETCTVGMFNMIKACNENNAVLIHTSTSEVYGDPECRIQSETYRGNVNPIGTRSCYDEGKRCAEAIIVNSGVKYAIARLFNTYGPGMSCNDGRVVTEFIKQSLQNDDVIVHNTGFQRRSFCYISDTIRGLLSLDENIRSPINIGNPDEYISITELAKFIIKLTKSSSKIRYILGDPEDPKYRRPSIERAKALINWSPTVDLKTGLLQTIDWMRNKI